jgi:DNA-binding transcriptional LysR family regulator
LDLHHLKYILVAAEEGSFQRAAERLKVAPSALSRRIQDLESELGIALFERISGGIRPSYAGGVMIDYGKRIFADVEAAAEHFRRLAKGQTALLRVGLNGIAPQLPIIPALLRSFRACHPETELKLLSLHSNEQLSALHDGSIDAGFLFGQPENEPDLDYLRLASHRFVLGLPAQHRLAQQAEIRLADLADEDFVLFTRDYSSGIYDRLMSNCRALGLEPRIIQETTSEHMQLGLIAAGMGISFVFDSIIARHNRPDIVTRPVAGLAVEEHLDLAWRRHHSAPALAQLILLAKAQTVQPG